MNEISLFSVNTVAHTHTPTHTYICVYLEQERKSTIRRDSERVANCVDKLFTFRLPATNTKWFN